MRFAVMCGELVLLEDGTWSSETHLPIVAILMAQFSCLVAANRAARRHRVAGAFVVPLA